MFIDKYADYHPHFPAKNNVSGHSPAKKGCAFFQRRKKAHPIYIEGLTT
jgi:hypothetical protein